MNWIKRGRLMGGLIISMAFVSANADISAMPAWDLSEESHDASQTSFSSAMSEAQTMARLHLDRFFLHVIDTEGRGRADAAVKIAVPVDDTMVEAIWITPFAEFDGQFIGILANDPQGLSDLGQGDAIMFDASQVRDWYFFGRDGKMYGSYTTRAMLPALEPAEAAEIAALLSSDPLPFGW